MLVCVFDLIAQPSRDAGLQGVVFLCFILFIIEFLVQTYALKEYRLSFFQVCASVQTCLLSVCFQ